ncbi:unnamed protein product, partial [Amoebophrya sp. A120]
ESRARTPGAAARTILWQPHELVQFQSVRPGQYARALSLVDQDQEALQEAWQHLCQLQGAVSVVDHGDESFVGHVGGGEEIYGSQWSEPRSISRGGGVIAVENSGCSTRTSPRGCRGNTKSTASTSSTIRDDVEVVGGDDEQSKQPVFVEEKRTAPAAVDPVGRSSCTSEIIQNI